MFQKLLSLVAISSFLMISNGFVFGKGANDWKAVESLVNHEVAVKLKNGRMNYGILKSVDANGLVLLIAGKKTMSQNEVTIRQIDVKKIWRALLFVNDRNAGKGAVIGAGVGAVALGVPAIAQGGNDDGLAGVAFFLGAITGAAFGGIAGFFVKTKHKTRDLVYEQ